MTLSRKVPRSALVPQVRVRSLDANLGILTLVSARPGFQLSAFEHHRATETQRHPNAFPFSVTLSRKVPRSALVPQVRVRSLDANLGILTLVSARPGFFAHFHTTGSGNAHAVLW